MKFNKYCISFLVCVVFLLPTESAFTDEDNQVNILNAALPNLAGLSLLIPPPVGPIMAGSIGMLHVAGVILADINADSNKGVSTAISQLDLLKSQQVIEAGIKNVDNHVIEASKRVIDELTHVMQSHPLMEELRKQLEEFQKSYADNMQLVLDVEATGSQKNSSLDAMLNYYSPFREELRSFITTYIKPRSVLATSGAVKLFYDYVLEKDQSLAKDNDDCYTDAVESKVFRSYMYILKTLTDTYVMVVSAHVMKFQQDIKDGRISDAKSTKKYAETIINDFKKDMQELSDKTKWALDNASRDIKNCGVFTNFERGVDYERLSFAKIIPRPMYMPEDVCTEDKDAISFKSYNFLNCDFDAGLVEGSHLSIFYNTSNLDGPYQYMKVELPNYAYNGTYGHEDTLVSQSRTNGGCKTTFCTIFKDRAVAISTKRVSAKPGNVITGLRFRIRKNVLYIDIQQGKFLDAITVDPKTVFWSETPESNVVTYLDHTARKIELGDFTLKDGFLTEIRMHLLSGERFDLVFHPFIEGTTNPGDPYGPFFYGPFQPVSELNEVKIKEADDPEILGITLKNLVSKAPRPQQPHYITFQPSDFQKDFGRTTVPFIDTREVVSDPPAPLGGFGMYHQAGKGSGGFLSLKLLAPKLSYLVDFKQIEQLINPITKALT